MNKCVFCGDAVEAGHEVCQSCFEKFKGQKDKENIENFIHSEPSNDKLEDYKKKYIFDGYYIIQEKENEVILRKDGKPVSHALHLLLSIITVGIWLFIWLFVCLCSEQEKTIILKRNDEDGSIMVCENNY